MIVRKLNSIPLLYHLASLLVFYIFSLGITSEAATIPEESLILSDWETGHFDTNLFR